jgi:hypothetical protein
MASIPGWVYIVLGAVMIGAAEFVNSKTKTNSLTIFFYIGILFLIIGVGKYLFNSIFKKKDDLGTKQARAHHIRNVQHQSMANQGFNNQGFAHQHPQGHQFPSHLQGQHHIQRVSQQSSAQPPTQSYPQTQQQQYQQFAQHPSIIACPACNTRHYDYANYCMKCGTRMKK